MAPLASEGSVKLVALQDLPNGVKAGAAYDERDGIASFLLAKGLARKAFPEIPPRVSYQPRRRSVQRDTAIATDELLDE